MNSQPFFSIILPTRNNAQYLKGAIATVLSQDFDDYELIVSNNFSSDNTDEVVRSFVSDKLKYVQTNKDMYIDESWNFALSHAMGKYILMIGDDDGVMKNGLKKLKEEIIEQNYPDLISQPIVRYFIDENRFNLIQIHYSKAKNARDGFDLTLKGVNIGIAVLHIIFKKELLKGILYSKPFPDYVALLKLLYWSKSIYYSDIYAVIHGHTKNSSGNIFGLKDIERLRELSAQSKGIVDNVPLDLCFFTNGYYASMRTALKELGLDMEIDWFRYFNRYHGELLSLKDYSDISKDLKLFYAALAKQPLKIQLKTKLYIFLRHGKRWLKKLMKMQTIEQAQESIAGEDYGINNILDLSQKLDDKTIAQIKQNLKK